MDFIWDDITVVLGEILSVSASVSIVYIYCLQLNLKLFTDYKRFFKETTTQNFNKLHSLLIRQ